MANGEYGLAELDGDTVELRYEPNGPVPLADLANSFAALDAIYAKTGGTSGKLAVTQLRTGSIIAALQPFLPMLGQTLPVIDAAITLSDFANRLRSALDAFSGRGTDAKPQDDPGDIAKELAEVLRPVAGRSGAEFGIAHVKYRSRTKGRTVEMEAVYNAGDIDRAAINAERYATTAKALIGNEEDLEAPQSLLRKVKLTLHQANSGPAKASGNTGDKGVIATESDKPLPVYFANGIGRLKEKMVRGAKNPLTVSYIVDALVTREGSAAKAYTVIEVYAPARSARPKALPLLEVHNERTKRRKVANKKG